MRKILLFLLPFLVTCKSPAPVSGFMVDHKAKVLKTGVSVRDISRGGATYRVISLDTEIVDLKMLSQLSTQGEVHNFKSLNARGPVSFAMNAGMFHRNMEPVGLYVEDGKTMVPLNLSNGSGNFFLKPNGVFALTSDGPMIAVSEQWNGRAKFATQSGPMLVVDGAIHPSFVKGSTNLNIRNGVGVTEGHFAHFVISLSPVSLYDFAEFFKEVIGCTNALYLDGHISQAYIPGLSNPFPQQEFGTFVYVE